MPVPPEPSPEAVADLKKAVIEKLGNEWNSLDKEDTERFENSDEWATRFLRHHYNDHKLALTMAVDSLKWRTETGASKITEDSINQELLKLGVLGIRNRDKDDCPMLILNVSLVSKSFKQEDTRKMFVYLLERIEREEPGKWMTIVFDCRNAGLKNMDMDLIQYVVNAFKFYYPFILNYILVLEMPWILNAIWKIIKTWLPPQALEKIRFLNKQTVFEYISQDQCLTGWGGTDDSEFKYIPEAKAKPITNGVTNGHVNGITNGLTNGHVQVNGHMNGLSNGDNKAYANGDVHHSKDADEIDHKKVSFDVSSSSSSSAKPGESVIDSSSVSGAVSLQITPSDEIVFPALRVGSIAYIKLKNTSKTCLAYKIKTTSPENYKVRPSTKILKEGEQEEVIITLCEAIPASSLVRDKFLIMVVPCDNNAVLDSAIFKDVNKDDLFECKLRIGLASQDIPVAAPPPPQPTVATIPPEIIIKLNELSTGQAALQQQISSSRTILYLMFLLVVVALTILVMSNKGVEQDILHACIKRKEEF